MNYYHELRRNGIISIPFLPEKKEQLRVICFKLDPDTILALDKLAYKYGKSRSEIIRYLIKKGLKEFI